MPTHLASHDDEFPYYLADLFPKGIKVGSRLKLGSYDLSARPVDSLDVRRPLFEAWTPYAMRYRISLATHFINTIQEIGYLLEVFWSGIVYPYKRPATAGYRFARHRLGRDVDGPPFCPYEEREKLDE